jgi:hypothetical protein
MPLYRLAQLTTSAPDAAGGSPRLQTGEVHDDCQLRPFHLDAICRELGEETLDQPINSLQIGQNVMSLPKPAGALVI